MNIQSYDGEAQKHCHLKMFWGLLALLEVSDSVLGALPPLLSLSLVLVGLRLMLCLSFWSLKWVALHRLCSPRVLVLLWPWSDLRDMSKSWIRWCVSFL